jgi:hypothetical protein
MISYTKNYDIAYDIIYDGKSNMISYKIW